MSIASFITKYKNQIIVIGIIVLIALFYYFWTRSTPLSCGSGQQSVTCSGVQQCVPSCTAPFVFDCDTMQCACPTGQSICGAYCCEPSRCNTGAVSYCCPEFQAPCNGVCCNSTDCNTGSDGQLYCCPQTQLCNNSSGTVCCPPGQICNNGTCQTNCGSNSDGTPQYCQASESCVVITNLLPARAQQLQTTYPNAVINGTTAYMCMAPNDCSFGNEQAAPAAIANFYPALMNFGITNSSGGVSYCSSTLPDNVASCYQYQSQTACENAGNQCDWRDLLTEATLECVTGSNPCQPKITRLNSDINTLQEYGYWCSTGANTYVRAVNFQANSPSACTWQNCFSQIAQPGVIDIQWDDANGTCTAIQDATQKAGMSIYNTTGTVPIFNGVFTGCNPSQSCPSNAGDSQCCCPNSNMCNNWCQNNGQISPQPGAIYQNCIIAIRADSTENVCSDGGCQGAQTGYWPGCDPTQEVFLESADCHGGTFGGIPLCGIVANIQVPQTGSNACPTAQEIFAAQGKSWPPNTDEWSRAFYSFQTSNNITPCSSCQDNGFANKISNGGQWLVDLGYANSTQVPKVSNPVLAPKGLYNTWPAGYISNFIQNLDTSTWCTGCGSGGCCNACPIVNSQYPNALNFATCPGNC